MLFKEPEKHLGQKVHSLIKSCPPLDLNSVYSYYLLCAHFAATSVVVTVNSSTDNETVIGFISAYRLPEQPETLFVWQVAAHSDYRGQGLAKKMLTHILERPVNSDCRFIQTTVGPTNKASLSFFDSWARSYNTSVDISAFLRSDDLGGGHDDEDLLTIGPFNIKGES